MLVSLKTAKPHKKSSQQPEPLLAEAPEKFGSTAVKVPQKFRGAPRSSRILSECDLCQPLPAGV